MHFECKILFKACEYMARNLFQKCVFHDLKIKRDLKMCMMILWVVYAFSNLGQFEQMYNSFTNTTQLE